MAPRSLAFALALLTMPSPNVLGQELQLTTAVGHAYDEVANCLIKQMAPRLVAVPVVRPPPTNKAEVHLYLPGTRETDAPVASFFISQLGNSSTVVFGERPDHRGKFVSAARGAALRCSR